MGEVFRAVDRNTPYMFAPTIEDWLPERHLARFVVEVVEQLDLRGIESSYAGRGHKAYSPAMMVSMLFYGYASGTFSSRKLEQATYDSVAMRYITADCHPDHDTIASFRKRFLEPLAGIFVQILLVANRMGLLRLGSVSLDGTKMKANASKHRAMSWKHMQELERQIREEVELLLAKAADADANELPDGLDIPEELRRREDRLEAIAQAKAEIERRAGERHERENAEYERKMAERERKERETGKKSGGVAPRPPEDEGPRDKDQVNLTDADSRIMPDKGGFEQGYNAQAAVDVDTMLVVTQHLSQNTNDMLEVQPTLELIAALPDELGEVENLLADTGYCSGGNVDSCVEAGMVPYISTRRERHNARLVERFAEDPPYEEPEDSVDEMRRRLGTKAGKRLYAKRKSTVETVFGNIKGTIGFRQFSLRGAANVSGEWTLVCAAWNLKRLFALTR